MSTLTLIRTYSAGVHVGELVHHEGTVVTLINASRIWRWNGANTLHELSLHGPTLDYTRISEQVPRITLTQAIELIPVSAEAVSAFAPRWPS